jgi:hypothetical protein
VPPSAKSSDERRGRPRCELEGTARAERGQGCDGSRRSEGTVPSAYPMKDVDAVLGNRSSEPGRAQTLPPC